MKKKLTLSLDAKICSEFQDYCEENAIMLSKKVEIWMKQFLEDTENSQKNSLSHKNQENRDFSGKLKEKGGKK